MGIAGYRTLVKLSGTPTVMTSEPMSTCCGSTSIYRVTDANKRIVDRNTSVTVNSTAGAVSSSLYTVNYLFGKVTVSSSINLTSITGKYLPVVDIAGANSYTLTQSRDILDDTDFASTGYRSKTVGLVDTSLTVSRWDSVDIDYYEDIKNATEVVVEVRPGGSTADVGRGYFLVESENRSGDVAALESADLSLQLDSSTKATFSWDSL